MTPGPDIGSRGHGIHRVAMPGPAEQTTHRRPHAIGHHEGSALHATALGPDGGHLAVVASLHVGHAHAVMHHGARLYGRLP